MMEEQIKNSLKIVCNLYKHDRVTEDELLTLIDVITNKDDNAKTTYYPITIPNDKDYPWDWINRPFYIGKPYCYTITTNKVDENTETNYTFKSNLD